MQGQKGSRSLAKGEVYLCVGNGARVAALAVGTYDLSLPSGLVFVGFSGLKHSRNLKI